MTTSHLFTTLERECLLDCSHMSAVGLDYGVLQLAESWGFYVSTEMRENAETVMYGTPEDEHYEVLRWDAEDAVDWLNEHKVWHGCVLTIEDNSLWIERVEEDA